MDQTNTLLEKKRTEIISESFIGRNAKNQVFLGIVIFFSV